jgi:hypothetical protein
LKVNYPKDAIRGDHGDFSSGAPISSFTMLIVEPNTDGLKWKMRGELRCTSGTAQDSTANNYMCDTKVRVRAFFLPFSPLIIHTDTHIYIGQRKIRLILGTNCSLLNSVNMLLVRLSTRRTRRYMARGFLYFAGCNVGVEIFSLSLILITSIYHTPSPSTSTPAR